MPQFSDKGYKYTMPHSAFSASGQRHSFEREYRKGKLAEEKSVRRKKETMAKKMKGHESLNPKRIGHDNEVMEGRNEQEKN